MNGVQLPSACAGVPSELLDPRGYLLHSHALGDET